MSFDWIQYLYLAEELRKESVSSSLSLSEARFRSAISRSYYAAFCGARNFLRDFRKEVIPSTPAAHRIVREIFENSINERELSVAADLERLRIDRNRVDYNDKVGGLDSMSDFAIKLSQSVFGNIRALQNK